MEGVSGFLIAAGGRHPKGLNDQGRLAVGVVGVPGPPWVWSEQSDDGHESCHGQCRGYASPGMGGGQRPRLDPFGPIAIVAAPHG
jgi:hypothetical protein